MKTYYNACSLCGSYSFEKLCYAFFKTKKFKLENIVICRDCGLVYKHPVIPEYEIIHYMESDHWKKPFFAKKLEKTADYIGKAVPKQKANSLIVDVGAAAGDLLHSLLKYYPKSRLIGIEPSVNACNIATNKYPDLYMLPCTIDECVIAPESVSIMTAIGVDYLFLDHNESLATIYNMLNKDGFLYIERNVFLESKAYVGRAIKTRRDLFGTNSMMKNWFTIKQMELQLTKYFSVVDRNEVLCNVVDGNKNISHGWLCKKLPKINTNINVPNDYVANLKYIKKMVY